MIKILSIDLKARRLILNMKQSEVAEQLNISYQQYQKYEYGILIPEVKKLFILAKLFDIPNNVLLDTLLIDYGIRNVSEAMNMIKLQKI